MIRAWLAALALAGCAPPSPPPDPLARAPLARWRTAGVRARRLAVFGVGTVEVPSSNRLLCNDGPTDDQRALCSFSLDPASGRTLSVGDQPSPDQVDVNDTFTPGDRPGYRNMTRINPEQRAASAGVLGQGRVLALDQGEAGGRAFAFGCWRWEPPGTPAPVRCTVSLDGAAGGAISAEFLPAPVPRGAPFTYSRARLLRLLALLAAVDSSFTRRSR